MDKPNVIVCAAVRLLDGTVIAGVRHFDAIMRQQLPEVFVQSVGEQPEQGFLDRFGNFLTREDAWVVADKAKQIKYRVGGDWNLVFSYGILYSENLY